MPFVVLDTNIPGNKIPGNLLSNLCTCVAATLGKPQERMNVYIRPGLPMLIAGSVEPAAVLSVSAIGVTDTAEKNRNHSAKICDFLSKELSIPMDRVLITFHALEPHQVGKMGTVMSFL